jgi:hypothetical protein
MCPLSHCRLLHQSGYHYFGWCSFYLDDHVKCILIYLVTLESPYSGRWFLGQHGQLISNSGVIYEKCLQPTTKSRYVELCNPGVRLPGSLPSTPVSSSPPPTSPAPSSSSSSAAAPSSPPPVGVTTRARAGVNRPSTRYPTDVYACAASTPSSVPTSVRAALRDPQWRAAM